MAKTGKEKAKRSTRVDSDAKGKSTPRSAAIARRGVRTGVDFANLMSAIMSDLIEGRIPASVGNATCNAGGKLLKVVELQMRYGIPIGVQGRKVLALADLEVAQNTQVI
jgi:hypothetical protein